MDNELGARIRALRKERGLSSLSMIVPPLP